MTKFCFQIEKPCRGQLQLSLNIIKQFPFKDNVSNTQDIISPNTQTAMMIKLEERILNIGVKKLQKPKGNSACTNHELLTCHHMNVTNLVTVDSEI